MTEPKISLLIDSNAGSLGVVRSISDHLAELNRAKIHICVVNMTRQSQIQRIAIGVRFGELPVLFFGTKVAAQGREEIVDWIVAAIKSSAPRPAVAATAGTTEAHALRPAQPRARPSRRETDFEKYAEDLLVDPREFADEDRCDDRAKTEDIARRLSHWKPKDGRDSRYYPKDRGIIERLKRATPGRDEEAETSAQRNFQPEETERLDARGEGRERRGASGGSRRNPEDEYEETAPATTEEEDNMYMEYCAGLMRSAD